MTTNTRKEFPPCKPVPVGEPILVYFSGKPPKVKEFKKKVRDEHGNVVKNEDGTDKETEIRAPEARVWFGIADANFPELVGQFHEFSGNPWIAPASPDGQGAKQPTKWYQTIEAMAGPEAVKAFAYKDALLSPEWVAMIEDPEEKERKQGKVIPDDQWKQLQGFYVAYFKEPRKEKGSDAYRLDKNGGVDQAIKEIRHPKALRWNVEQVKLWPPPEKPIGQPKTNNASVGQQNQAALQRETPKETPPAKVPPAPIGEVLDEIKILLTPQGPCRIVAKQYLLLKEKAKVTDLAESDARHLLVLLKCQTWLAQGGDYDTTFRPYLEKCGKQNLWELSPGDAEQLLRWFEEIAADVPF